MENKSKHVLCLVRRDRKKKGSECRVEESLETIKFVKDGERVKRARESCSLESAYKYATSFVWSEYVRERERAIESKKITRLQ